MLTRRAWLAALAPPEPACYSICAFDGRSLRTPRPCGPQLPGSTFKPLLATLCDAGWRFPCRRTLRLGGHLLDCTHAPLPGTLDLQTALAASCNSWFAQAAARLDGEALQRLVRSFEGQAASLRSPAERTLAALGVEHLWFTPSALARAYARLRSEAVPAVLQGLAESVRNGTSIQAGELFEAGKTGTVRGGAWFAGWTSRAVIALFSSAGAGGADAAPLAREIMAKWHAAHAG